MTVSDPWGESLAAVVDIDAVRWRWKRLNDLRDLARGLPVPDFGPPPSDDREVELHAAAVQDWDDPT